MEQQVHLSIHQTIVIPTINTGETTHKSIRYAESASVVRQFQPPKPFIPFPR